MTTLLILALNMKTKTSETMYSSTAVKLESPIFLKPRWDQWIQIQWYIRILYNLGCPPSQDSSHHQDYYILGRESQPKPSFATVTGRGDNPIYNIEKIAQAAIFSWISMLP